MFCWPRDCTFHGSPRSRCLSQEVGANQCVKKTVGFCCFKKMIQQFVSKPKFSNQTPKTLFPVESTCRIDILFCSNWKINFSISGAADFLYFQAGTIGKTGCETGQVTQDVKKTLNSNQTKQFLMLHANGVLHEYTARFLLLKTVKSKLSYDKQDKQSLGMWHVLAVCWNEKHFNYWIFSLHATRFLHWECRSATPTWQLGHVYSSLSEPAKEIRKSRTLQSDCTQVAFMDKFFLILLNLCRLLFHDILEFKTTKLNAEANPKYANWSTWPTWGSRTHLDHRLGLQLPTTPVSYYFVSEHVWNFSGLGSLSCVQFVAFTESHHP